MTAVGVDWTIGVDNIRGEDDVTGVDDDVIGVVGAAVVLRVGVETEPWRDGARVSGTSVDQRVTSAE